MNKVFMFPPEGPKPICGREAWADEFATAAAWDRPVRSYHSDTPTYPWMPQQFRVSFKLGYQ